MPFILCSQINREISIFSPYILMSENSSEFMRDYLSTESLTDRKVIGKNDEKSVFGEDNQEK